MTTTVSSLASSTLLASTLVYNEDLDDSQDNPLPHSNLSGGMSLLTTQVEEESTSRSRLPLNFDGQDRHLPYSSCTKDGFESGRSGTVVHFPRSATLVRVQIVPWIVLRIHLVLLWCIPLVRKEKGKLLLYVLVVAQSSLYPRPVQQLSYL